MICYELWHILWQLNKVTKTLSIGVVPVNPQEWRAHTDQQYLFVLEIVDDMQKSRHLHHLGNSQRILPDVLFAWLAGSAAWFRVLSFVGEVVRHVYKIMCASVSRALFALRHALTTWGKKTSQVVLGLLGKLLLSLLQNCYYSLHQMTMRYSIYINYL